VISFCLTLAALLIGLDRSVTGPRWSRFRSPRHQTISADLARYDLKTFPVVRVVDGDTLHLDVPDGGGRVTKVRLLGIDAPEMGDAQRKPMYFAEEATRFARDLALGKTVTVYLDQQAGSRDKYDRLLAYIALPDGRFLNEELLLGGYAYADLRFRHSYYYKYRQLEASARALKAGLWAGVFPEQMPAWRQRTAPDAE
jgi:endonuclease YncB( thermonuclease family)